MELKTYVIVKPGRKAAMGDIFCELASLGRKGIFFYKSEIQLTAEQWLSLYGCGPSSQEKDEAKKMHLQEATAFLVYEHPLGPDALHVLMEIKRLCERLVRQGDVWVPQSEADVLLCKDIFEECGCFPQVRRWE